MSVSALDDAELSDLIEIAYLRWMVPQSRIVVSYDEWLMILQCPRIMRFMSLLGTNVFGDVARVGRTIISVSAP